MERVGILDIYVRKSRDHSREYTFEVNVRPDYVEIGYTRI
jgi:hypothetical protein